ncbi:MAG TPA: flagellar motor switch protein FliN [Verrucomicrobiae bacterium]|nr:flagellar motor switch protein FliN [Verrucomicrobiae bacterium]
MSETLVAQPPTAARAVPANLDMVLDVPVSLSVELGSTQLPMKDVLELGEGSVITLDKEADAPVELFINGRLIARGEVVVVEDRFGIKITELLGKV